MILAYHEITENPSPYIYSLTAERFEDHLRTLKALERPGRVTFDDGHVSQHRLALPLLERHGEKAIFFVTAGWTGTVEGYMNRAELRELTSCGHEVQAHGWSHKFLTKCSAAELERELRQARGALEDVLGSRVDALSAPGGRWNRRVLQAAIAAGYRRFYHSNPWMKPAVREGLSIAGRHMVRRGMSGADLRSLLEAGPGRHLAEFTAHALKLSVKTVLGDRIYQRLWEIVGAARPRGTGVEDFY